MGSLQICWHLRATNFCFILIIYCCSVTVGISTVLPEVAQEVPALLLLKLLVFAWPQFNACRLSIVANNILQLSLQAMCNRPCIGICSLTAPPTGSGRSGRLKGWAAETHVERSAKMRIYLEMQSMLMHAPLSMEIRVAAASVHFHHCGLLNDHYLLAFCHWWFPR